MHRNETHTVEFKIEFSIRKVCFQCSYNENVSTARSVTGLFGQPNTSNKKRGMKKYWQVIGFMAVQRSLETLGHPEYPVLSNAFFRVPIFYADGFFLIPI